VANTDSVVRYAYKPGDLKATGKPETVIASLPSSRPRDEVAWRAYDAAVEAGKPVPDHGHWTRDLALSLDGKRLFVGVGSASNLDDPDDHPGEARRAAILEYTPEGKFVKVYASGIRNPSGIAVDPFTGQLWCSVNERDGMGDDLPPDYISHVEEGGFYGWPWYYLGPHPDPRSRASIRNCKTKPSRPTSCSSRTQLRFRWRSTTARNSPPNIVATSSPVSTARGTGWCDPATKWCGSRSKRQVGWRL
jgi:glucose/arabinose dehydrogenase